MGKVMVHPIQKEVCRMVTKKYIAVALIATLVLVSQALGKTSKPVHLRLNWKRGETYKYKCVLNGKVSAAGESATMQVAFDVALRVLRSPRTGEANSTVKGHRNIADNSQSFALGGRLLEVEVRHGDVNMILHVPGQKIDVTIGKEKVHASVNGNSVPSSKLDEFREEVKPLQEILKAPIRLLLTDSGRVMRLSGLEELDPAMQKELAMGFLEGMLLPEKPMKLGDKFVDKRSLDSLFPKQPAQSSSPLAGRTIEIVRTLRVIRRGKNGRVVAEFSAPLKEKFEDVRLDGDGTQGSAEADMIYTTIVDAKDGTIVQETAKGRVLLRPKGGRMPGLIRVEINARIELIEPEKLRLTAYGLGGTER